MRQQLIDLFFSYGVKAFEHSKELVHTSLSIPIFGYPFLSPY